jgi:hypothetical protein
VLMLRRRDVAAIEQQAEDHTVAVVAA